MDWVLPRCTCKTENKHIYAASLQVLCGKCGKNLLNCHLLNAGVHLDNYGEQSDAEHLAYRPNLQFCACNNEHRVHINSYAQK